MKIKKKKYALNVTLMLTLLNFCKYKKTDLPVIDKISDHLIIKCFSNCVTQQKCCQLLLRHRIKIFV